MEKQLTAKYVRHNFLEVLLASFFKPLRKMECQFSAELPGIHMHLDSESTVEGERCSEALLELLELRLLKISKHCRSYLREMSFSGGAESSKYWKGVLRS